MQREIPCLIIQDKKVKMSRAWNHAHLENASCQNANKITTALYAITHPKAMRTGPAESSFVVYKQSTEGIPVI